MTIEPVIDKDLSEILTLQKECYIEEAELYNDHSIPPLTQTIESIKADLDGETFYKVKNGNRIIGSVRIKIDGDTGKIGRLIVHKDFRNLGIGKKLMNFVEITHNDLGRFELFTGHKSDRNLYLYNKLGYSEFKRVRINENLELVFLQKIIDKPVLT